MRNLGFVVKNLPFARGKAEQHLQRAIELADEIGARVISSQAYFDLALLHKSRKRPERAKECLSEAIAIFEECGASVYLKQAKQTLVSLG
jgi:tetratricopeptide (TPR) repeat protein